MDHNVRRIRESNRELKTATHKIGLVLNADKTKFMVTRRKIANRNSNPIMIGSDTFETV